MQIGNISALAGRLNYPEELLHEISYNSHQYYRPFHLVVTKTDGKGAQKKKTRHIDNPVKKLPLRALQKKIKNELLNSQTSKLDSSMIGGIKKRNISMFLAPHIGKQTIVCMDLSNCFPNISKSRVYNVWRHQLGYSDDEAKLLTAATTFRGYLPQGAPTSSMLCNFALNPMAKKIRLLLEKNGVEYTQYIDDICFSGDDIIVRRMISEIYPIVSSFGQKINRGKTEIIDSKKKQQAMGIVINTRTKVDSKYINKIAKTISGYKPGEAISSGEFLSIAGKILHVQRFDKAQATRLSGMLEEKLLNQYDEPLQKNKSEEIKECRVYRFDKLMRLKCQYLK